MWAVYLLAYICLGGRTRCSPRRFPRVPFTFCARWSASPHAHTLPFHHLCHWCFLPLPLLPATLGFYHSCAAAEQLSRDVMAALPGTLHRAASAGGMTPLLGWTARTPFLCNPCTPTSPGRRRGIHAVWADIMGWPNLTHPPPHTWDMASRFPPHFTISLASWTAPSLVPASTQRGTLSGARALRLPPV